MTGTGAILQEFAGRTWMDRIIAKSCSSAVCTTTSIIGFDSGVRKKSRGIGTASSTNYVTGAGRCQQTSPFRLQREQYHYFSCVRYLYYYTRTHHPHATPGSFIGVRCGGVGDFRCVSQQYIPTHIQYYCPASVNPTLQ